MKYSQSYQSCGYESCSCREVTFISRGGTSPLSTDYCVDGKRIRIVDGEPLPAPIFTYALNKYAAFLNWHCENRTAGKILDRNPHPFEYNRAE